MTSINHTETALLEQIRNVLSNFPKYWNDYILLKNKLLEDLRSYEENIIKALLSNKLIKDTYSIDLDGITVFKVEDFISMLRYKNYWEDSFTKYSNEIGLTSAGKYLKYNSDIVLDFPHKDGVLEGGMTTEDESKKEIYYHNVLAKEEIDIMLSPKVLTNNKKYDKHGKHNTHKINLDDNLVIKGNNLISLSSLLKRYQGKIKCIYIDPPYNPRSDANTFAYNNRFNHSTWLTFMKNRLELAYDLLSDDGIIFIDIDHNELFYLGALTDEIFGYENRIGNLAIVHNLKGRYNGYFSIAHENKIVYAKNSENVVIKDMLDDTSHNYPHEDNISKYKTVSLQRSGNGSLREERPNLFYPIYYNVETGEISTVKTPYSTEIWPIDDNGIERRWRWSKEKLEKEWRTETIVKKQKDRYKIYTKIRIKGERPKTLWNKPEYSGTSGTNRLKELIGENEFSYPKSLQLVMDSLSIATNEDSIVLDFFGGSGTTGDAVMELNKIDQGSRKFILVEQMNYIDTILIPRLNSVIKNNQNNESFISTELYSLNEKYVQEIQKVESDIELRQVINHMKKEAFLDFKVNIDRITNDDEGFVNLSLEEKKDVLIQALDANQMYLNYSEIDNEDYGISEEVKQFNHSFYEDGDAQ